MVTMVCDALRAQYARRGGDSPPRILLFSSPEVRDDWNEGCFEDGFEVRVATDYEGLGRLVAQEEFDVLLCVGSFDERTLAGILRYSQQLADQCFTLLVPKGRDCSALIPSGSANDGLLVLPADTGIPEARFLCQQLARKVQRCKRGEQLAGLLDGLVASLVHALEIRQPVEVGHSTRVAHYALAIAHELGVPEEDRITLRLGALLHDVGKLTLPGLVLGKPAELTEEEYAIARAHTTRGYRLLSGVAGLREVRDIVRWHHEAYDGSGYPDGLRGGQIPLLARIVAVAETYDAMTSPRPYQTPVSHEEALAKLTEAAGKQFDPEVVAALERLRVHQNIWKTLERSDNLPVISAVLTRALELLCTPQPDFEELAQVLGSDPGFVTRILRYVNSARFGLLTQVTDIRRALVVLGMRQIYRIVVAASTRDVLSTDELRDLWEHSLTTAFAAETIAVSAPSVLPNEAFLAGLLHDLGKVVLCRAFPSAYRKVLALEEHGVMSYIAETLVFGANHAEVGAWLAKRWDLPDSIVTALEKHHSFAVAAEPLVAVVALADQAAHTVGNPSLAWMPFDGGLLERCEQTPENLIQIAREAKENATETIRSLEEADSDV